MYGGRKMCGKIMATFAKFYENYKSTYRKTK
jgi:hypothetical protein